MAEATISNNLAAAQNKFITSHKKSEKRESKSNQKKQKKQKKTKKAA
jgi:hypothetical protein